MTLGGEGSMNRARLRELLDYEPETGIFTNRFSRGRAKAGCIAGCLNALGYIRICLDGVDYSGHRLAWLYEYGVIPPNKIDHVNLNRSDNRIANLRMADNSQNNQNRPLQANNTSGFKGVSFNKSARLWHAYAQHKGKRYSAGYHKNPIDAYRASSALRESLHGEFALSDYRKQEPKP